jgi:thiamine biosynthesis lipoprotein
VTRHVVATMGTVASIDTDDAALVSAVTAAFERWEGTFSLYREHTELSRIAGGTLALMDASELVRSTYASALEWSSLTHGAFTPHRPDGVIDLDGIVKALAIAEAGAILDASGEPWVVNVGGDILASVRTDDAPLPLGVIDPADRSSLLTTIGLRGRRRAMATSGSAERGDHIWLSGSAAPAEFVQVTVIANDIVTADVLATAIVAGGRAALDSLAARFEVDVLTIDRTGALLATPGLQSSLTTR